MPDSTPLLGFPFMVDGDAANPENLQQSLRLLDASSNLVLQSTTVVATPTNPQPGQAWFLPSGQTITGDWATAFASLLSGGQLSAPILAVYVQQSGASAGVSEWKHLSVPDVLYGYVADLDGRYDWNGSVWSPASKVQSMTWHRFWTSSLPVVNPGTTAAYTLMQAPFDMTIVGVTLVFAGGADTGGGVKAMFAPAIRHTSDASQSFALWTSLVTDGSATESGDWDGATMADVSADAYDLGATLNSTILTTLASTTIPEGDTIGMGDWNGSSLGTAAQLDDCTLTSITINYTAA